MTDALTALTLNSGPGGGWVPPSGSPGPSVSVPSVTSSPGAGAVPSASLSSAAGAGTESAPSIPAASAAHVDAPVIMPQLLTAPASEGGGLIQPTTPAIDSGDASGHTMPAVTSVFTSGADSAAGTDFGGGTTGTLPFMTEAATDSGAGSDTGTDIAWQPGTDAGDWFLV